jgi:glycosyltransferase involved in cell wall biosynthesis
VSWQELQQHLAAADLFLFTSLRDTLGIVNFEAIAQGCPVMCLDHNGVGAHLPDDAAVKIPVTSPATVIREMARKIEALASDRESLQRMSEAACRFAEGQRWDRRAVWMEQLYRQVLQQRAANRGAAVPNRSYTPPGNRGSRVAAPRRDH